MSVYTYTSFQYLPTDVGGLPRARKAERGMMKMLPKISYARGKGYIRHNNREFISPNVDPKRIKDNVIIKQQNIEDAYEEIFGEALRKYNAKQKRNDRKIDNYFEKLFEGYNKSEIIKNKDKQQSFYEYVVGIGNKDTHGFKANPEAAKIAVECLKEYIDGFQQRNPNLYIFNATIHCDEQTPHLHFDIIPFADGYKKGMERQQSITKALQQMGYGYGKDAPKNFTKAEREVFKKICEAHGIEVAKEEKGRGKTYTPNEYKELKEQMKEEIMNEKDMREMTDEKRKLVESVALLKVEKMQLEQGNEVLKAVKIPPRPTLPDEPYTNALKEKMAYKKEYKEAIRKQEEWDNQYKPLQKAEKIIEREGEVINRMREGLQEVCNSYNESCAEVAKKERMINSKLKELDQKIKAVDEKAEKLEQRERHLNLIERRKEQKGRTHRQFSTYDDYEEQCITKNNKDIERNVIER